MTLCLYIPKTGYSFVKQRAIKPQLLCRNTGAVLMPRPIIIITSPSPPMLLPQPFGQTSDETARLGSFNPHKTKSIFMDSTHTERSLPTSGSHRGGVVRSIWDQYSEKCHNQFVCAHRTYLRRADLVSIHRTTAPVYDDDNEPSRRIRDMILSCGLPYKAS